MTSLQNNLFRGSLFLSCFSCAEKENCVDEIMTGNVECLGRNKTATVTSQLHYSHHPASYTVFKIPPEVKSHVFIRLKYGKEKLTRNFDLRFRFSYENNMIRLGGDKVRRYKSLSNLQCCLPSVFFRLFVFNISQNYFKERLYFAL